ncbi:MAG TPA: helix-turn-helix domain-containing protein [Thermoplasmata archaeon]|nr:helix-turn-helix domain-containing protein [Thermoplasmata archaeon]
MNGDTGTPLVSAPMMEFNPLLPRSKVGLLRLLIRGESTASELASRAGLHPTVVRRHLNDLTAAGLVESAPRPASRGRPAIVYRVSLSGRELVAAKYDVVLERLASSMLARSGDRAAAELFSGAAKDLVAAAGGARPEGEVVRLCQEFGFEPELRRSGKEHLLLSHNCPILRVARRHPELTCDAFHSTLVGDLYGTSPRPLRQAISRGALYCIHELDAPT